MPSKAVCVPRSYLSAVLRGIRWTGCVTWVASPSALKHPINSAPSSALRQHVKHGPQS